MRWDLVVNSFVRDAVQRRSIVVFEPEFRRNFLHVRDAARAILHASLQPVPDGAYNVGLIQLTKLGLASLISRVVPCEVLVGQEGSDPDRRDYLVSTKKFSQTGFEEHYTLGGGIEELAVAAWSST